MVESAKAVEADDKAEVVMVVYRIHFMTIDVMTFIIQKFKSSQLFDDIHESMSDDRT